LRGISSELGLIGLLLNWPNHNAVNRVAEISLNAGGPPFQKKRVALCRALIMGTTFEEIKKVVWDQPYLRWTLLVLAGICFILVLGLVALYVRRRLVEKRKEKLSQLPSRTLNIRMSPSPVPDLANPPSSVIAYPSK
jgi:hypothetical protein